MYRNKSPEERFEHSFDVVENHYNLPRLLDVEDMNRARIDDQSVITYLMSLNKVMPEQIPVEPPPQVSQLRTEILRAGTIGLVEEELPSEDSLTDEDLTPVDCENLPQIMAQRELSTSATPEPEDKDSGLEDSPSFLADKTGESWVPTSGDLDSHRGSTLTLDSEAEYVSATSSPVMSNRKINGVGTPNHMEPSSLLPTDYSKMDKIETDAVETEISPDTEELERQPLAELEAELEIISALPENVLVTLENMHELRLHLAEKRDDCTELQKQISDQLNSKQDREKRADLHKLLNQTGKLDEALHTAVEELDSFNSALEGFETANTRCLEFAEQAEQFLAFEEVVPVSSEETKFKLAEQQALLAKLETEQRHLEMSHRDLARSVPKIVTLSLHEQIKTVTANQNSLSDVEGVLNGSVEALSFLSTRLPSLEQKLEDADEILTRVEDKLDDGGEFQGNLEDVQLQIDRATTHLATVENLFSAIESFSSEFNMEPLQEQWEETSKRAAKCGEIVQDLVAAEEAHSEEVVAISEWAETLETFLIRKIKPIENREQLKNVQVKWREVADDLNTKCTEIDALLHSEYTTQDHRVMSPLDRDTLLSLKNQLFSLKGQLQTRREVLQDAYANWGNVESQMRALSTLMTELEFKPNDGGAGNRSGAMSGPWAILRGAWSVRPVLRQVDNLAVGERDLEEQREQLQCLVENIGDLPGVIVDTSHVERERDSLLNKHAVLCKRASNKRTRLQGSSLRLEPVLPFLRPVHLEKIRWLYNQPLPDIESRRDYSTSRIVAQLNSPISLKNVKYSQYWHVVKTVAPEKIPNMLLHLVAFAIGPWGMGCATDRPLMISFYTPDVKI